MVTVVIFVEQTILMEKTSTYWLIFFCFFFLAFFCCSTQSSIFAVSWRIGIIILFDRNLNEWTDGSYDNTKKKNFLHLMWSFLLFGWFMVPVDNRSVSLCKIGESSFSLGAFGFSTFWWCVGRLNWINFSWWVWTSGETSRNFSLLQNYFNEMLKQIHSSSK